MTWLPGGTVYGIPRAVPVAESQTQVEVLLEPE